MFNTQSSTGYQNPFLPQNRNLNDILTQYQITQQTIQQQPRPNAITELDEFMNSLTVDKKTAVETNTEYQTLKLRLFEKFLTYSIALTPIGDQFLSTPLGRKLSQDLLDTAQKVSSNFEDESKNEFEEMKKMISQQSAVISELQKKLASQENRVEFPSESGGI